MKPSSRIALMFTLSAALLSASALAQTGAAPAAAPAAPAAAAAPAAPAPAAASVPADAVVLPPAPAKKKAKSGYSRGTAYYNQCLKENMADAEHFCASHSSGCEAEKAGVAKQCKSEARGERQKG